MAKAYFPKFSAAEYEQRYVRTRAAMGDRGLDGLLIYGACSFIGTDGGQPNLRYISNFRDYLQAYVIFPLNGEPILYTSFVGHAADAREMSPIRDVRVGALRLPEQVAEGLREKDLDRGTVGLVGDNSARRITIPHEHYQLFREACPQARFPVATDLLEELRLIKSPEEIAFLERGAAITDAAFEAQVAATRPGIKDHDLYTEILSASHRHGGTLCFALVGSTPMSDPAMAFPNPYPSDRELEPGDIVLNEISSAYGGYSGQLIRPVAVGEPTAEYRDLFGLALEVYRRMAAVLRPGCTEQDLLKAAQPILDAGLTTHAPLFHGWGNMLEPPILGLAGTTFYPAKPFVLRENHAVVIEPNPCTRDGKRGIFLGDLWLITKDGARSLHRHPPDRFVVA